MDPTPQRPQEPPEPEQKPERAPGEPSSTEVLPRPRAPQAVRRDRATGQLEFKAPKTISFSVPEANKIQSAAEARGVSFAQYVRDVLELWFSRIPG